MVNVSVAEFVRGCCIVAGRERCVAVELRTAYLRWAIDRGAGKGSGVALADAAAFAGELRAAAPGVFSFESKAGQRVWCGIGLNAAAQGTLVEKVPLLVEPASDSADAQGCAEGGVP